MEPLPRKDHGRPVRGPLGFDHVSFGVDSEDELWEIRDRLAAAGFRVSNAVDHGFVHPIYPFDPNGIPLEFSHDVRGIDVRSNPFMEDVDPVETAREGRAHGWEVARGSRAHASWRKGGPPGRGSELYRYLRYKEEG